MATWTNVPNSSIETDKPVRAVDIRALRDNPIAIAGGASGAPRIDGSTGPAVNTGGIFNDAVTTPKLQSSERMTTANVLGQTAGASVNSVGAYALLFSIFNEEIAAGATRAGSRLQFTNAAAGSGTAPTPAGTWRCMGVSSDIGSGSNLEARVTTWLRIS